MNGKIVKLGIGAMFLLTMVSCMKKKSTDNTSTAQTYPTMTVTEQTVDLQTDYPVTIKGKEDVAISPRVDGFIKNIFVDEGSVVKKGQVLFTIDSPQSVENVRAAQAAIINAKAAISTAKINVVKTAPLVKEGIVSDVQLKTYQDALSSANATLAQALASYRNAKAALSWTSVTSPVNGIVGKIAYRQGSLVNSANVLTTVANISDVYAYFSLNEKSLLNFLDQLPGRTQAEKIKRAPLLTLTLADGTVYSEKGKLETISGIVDVTTGTANFRARFSNKKGLLRSGISGKISIPRTMNNVFLIPQEATFALQDKILVYKVQGDSVVQKTISVEPTPNGKSYAVTNGLNSGDRIVTSGIATLTEGQKIKY